MKRELALLSLLAAMVSGPAGAEDGPRPGDDAFLRGMQAKSKRQHADALREFSAAAESGHTEAQYLLGLQYLRGDGVKADP